MRPISPHWGISTVPLEPPWALKLRQPKQVPHSTFMEKAMHSRPARPYSAPTRPLRFSVRRHYEDVSLGAKLVTGSKEIQGDEGAVELVARARAREREQRAVSPPRLTMERNALGILNMSLTPVPYNANIDMRRGNASVATGSLLHFLAPTEGISPHSTRELGGMPVEMQVRELKNMSPIPDAQH